MCRKIIRKTTKPNINEITGLSDTTLWRLEKDVRFPRRIRLGENSVGWREDEVLAWLDARERGARRTVA